MTHAPPATLGIDIGGTHISAAVVGPRHAPRARQTAPTPAADGSGAVLATVVRLARAALAAVGDDEDLGPVSAIGVGTAGVVGPDGRTVTHATDALSGWADTAVADHLEDALGRPVTVLGDVQAFLAGEVAAGAAAGVGCALGVMAGTGIGGAVWARGGVLRGPHGTAGHLGHVPVPGAEHHVCPCGRPGHVEAIASGPAMTRLFRDAHPGLPVTDLRDVATLAARGHDGARQTLTAGGHALGLALGGVVNTLDPDLVVFDGGVTRSGPWYAAGLREALATTLLPSLARVPLVAAALGPEAVLVGAADQAAQVLARGATAQPTGTPDRQAASR